MCYSNNCPGENSQGECIRSSHFYCEYDTCDDCGEEMSALQLVDHTCDEENKEGDIEL
jgi:hypothetical protein